MRYESQWIRIAGNAKAVKAGSKKAWRCNPSSTNEVTEVERFKMTGNSTEKNCFFRTVVDHPETADGLTAWIDMYGTLTIDGETALVELENPA